MQTFAAWVIAAPGRQLSVATHWIAFIILLSAFCFILLLLLLLRRFGNCELVCVFIFYFLSVCLKYGEKGGKVCCVCFFALCKVIKSDKVLCCVVLIFFWKSILWKNTFLSKSSTFVQVINNLINFNVSIQKQQKIKLPLVKILKPFKKLFK